MAWREKQLTEHFHRPRYSPSLSKIFILVHDIRPCLNEALALKLLQRAFFSDTWTIVMVILSWSAPIRICMIETWEPASQIGLKWDRCTFTQELQTSIGFRRNSLLSDSLSLPDFSLLLCLFLDETSVCTIMAPKACPYASAPPTPTPTLPPPFGFPL